MKKDGIQTRKRKPKNLGKNKTNQGKSDQGKISHVLNYFLLLRNSKIGKKKKKSLGFKLPQA